jgi:hypothetical protein
MSDWRDSLPQFVTESRRAQGLPDRVEDPDALHKVATLLHQQLPRPNGRHLGRPGSGAPRRPSALSPAPVVSAFEGASSKPP